MAVRMARGPEPSFEQGAAMIMDRWARERNPRVSASEVELARSYLQAAGVGSAALRDGRFVMTGPAPSTVDGTQLVLLGLRHFVRSRR